MGLVSFEHHYFSCLTNSQATAYALGEGIRVGGARQKIIAKLVVLGLRHKAVKVHPDYRVLHPAAYLSYHDSNIK